MNAASPVLPALSAELARASRRISRREQRRWRTTRLVTAALLAVLVATAVAAATGLWQPQLGDDRLGHATPSETTPPADQLARLGVLRREQTDEDRGAVSLYALKFLDPAFDGVRTAYVRVLDTRASGLGEVLVPVARYHAKRDALCLFSEDSYGGGVSCWTTAEILSVNALLIAQTVPPHWRPGSDDLAPLTRRYMGLAPDGVKSVEVRDQFGSASAPVHDNFFSATVATAPVSVPPRSGRSPGLELDFLDAQGAVVAKRTPPPQLTPAAARAFCLRGREPARCLRSYAAALRAQRKAAAGRDVAVPHRGPGCEGAYGSGPSVLGNYLRTCRSRAPVRKPARQSGKAGGP